MTWEYRTVEEQREQFVIAAQSNKNFSAVCREFGITRKTGYKWLERFRSGESMSDRSRAPVTTANRTSAEAEQLVLNVRSENPGWGARRIHRVLLDAGYTDLPCARTVNNILQRHGCIDPEESEKRKPYIRYAKEHSNDMWQTDFKGDFLLGNDHRCYPLDILDDCTRFAIAICPAETTAGVVIPTFKAAFQEYGLPNSILSDNGAQFAGFKQGYTSFEKWLMDLDILPIHGRAYHPQTQGKIERFHRTMKTELLKHNTFENIEEIDKALQEWRMKYNTIRPHEALNMRRPADVYVPSARRYPNKISKYEYSGKYHVIKVSTWGYLRFANFQDYLSETMRGEYIEFRPSDDGEVFYLCYRNFKIAEYDAATRKRINRKIQRL